MSLLERCPRFRGCYVQASMESGPEICPYWRGVLVSEGVIYRLQWSWAMKMYVCLFEVSSFQRVLCTGFNGVGTLNVSLLERCPRFRGCYIQASMELRPIPVRGVSSFRGCYVQASMELGPKDV